MSNFVSGSEVFLSLGCRNGRALYSFSSVGSFVCLVVGECSWYIAVSLMVAIYLPPGGPCGFLLVFVPACCGRGALGFCLWFVCSGVTVAFPLPLSLIDVVCFDIWGLCRFAVVTPVLGLESFWSTGLVLTDASISDIGQILW